MNEKKMSDVFELPWRVETIKKENNYGGVQSFGVHIAIVDAADNTILSHITKAQAEAIVRAVNKHDEFMEVAELVLDEFLPLVR